MLLPPTQSTLQHRLAGHEHKQSPGGKQCQLTCGAQALCQRCHDGVAWRSCHSCWSCLLLRHAVVVLRLQAQAQALQQALLGRSAHS
jgi:hypothetical protein